MDEINTEEFESITMRTINDDRRRSRSVQEWLFILALVSNFAGIIWFTANVKASLDSTMALTQNLVGVTNRIVDKQAQQDINIAIIKSKLNLNQ